MIEKVVKNRNSRAIRNNLNVFGLVIQIFKDSQVKSDTGNINDDWGTQIEITDMDSGTQMTTRTPGQRECK